MLLLLLLAIFAQVLAKKTNKEWNALDKNAIQKMHVEEHEALKALGDEVQIDKPGMVFVTFREDTSRREREQLARLWQDQLMTAGIKTSLFPTDGNGWLLTTLRNGDNFSVLQFLLSQPDVMKASLDNMDQWNLPRYQKEYEAAQQERANKRRRMPGDVDSDRLEL